VTALKHHDLYVTRSVFVRAIRVQHTEHDFCRLVEWINGHGLSCDQVLEGICAECDIRWWVLTGKTVRVYTDAEFATLYQAAQ
jgi:hypothetical protein